MRLCTFFQHFGAVLRSKIVQYDFASSCFRKGKFYFGFSKSICKKIARFRSSIRMSDDAREGVMIRCWY